MACPDNDAIRFKRSSSAFGAVGGLRLRELGAYFVTICVDRKRAAFGRIIDGEMRLHPYGKIVLECWGEISAHCLTCFTDEFVMMPNHVHGIVFLEGAGAKEQEARFGASQSASLASIINGFKGAATRRIRALRNDQVKVWQRGFHERIVRDEKELDAIRRYIIENPMNWATDEHNQ